MWVNFFSEQTLVQYYNNSNYCGEILSKFEFLQVSPSCHLCSVSLHVWGSFLESIVLFTFLRCFLNYTVTSTFWRLRDGEKNQLKIESNVTVLNWIQLLGPWTLTIPGFIKSSAHMYRVKSTQIFNPKHSKTSFVEPWSSRITWHYGITQNQK